VLAGFGNRLGGAHGLGSGVGSGCACFSLRLGSRWDGRGTSGIGGLRRRGGSGGGSIIPLPVVERLDFFQLLVNEIRGVSTFGNIPDPNEIVDEQAAWKRRLFFESAFLVGKEYALRKFQLKVL
jgi:hypothetical protein